MADIFNEIDEELRQEKLKKLWDRWGVLILVAAVAVVVAVAGWRLWQNHRATLAEGFGDRFVAANEIARNGDAKGAEEAFLSLAKDGIDGYPALAAMRAAAARAEAGEIDQAIVAFDALAADKKIPARVAEMARIRAAYLALETEDRAAVEARTAPLVGAGRPYAAQASEVRILAAWKAGDVADVSKRISELEADVATPRDVLERIAVLSALVKAQGSAGKAN